MQCSDVMKVEVECVSPQTNVRDAARKMRDHNVGFLPVCDESMRVVGTITDRDIAVRAVAEEVSPDSPLTTVLTQEVIACRPEDDLGYARELMAQHHISRIMCIGRTGRIEGVISLSDLAQLHGVDSASTLREVAARETRNAPRSP